MRNPVDPQDPAVGDESRPHRRVDGLRADEVPDRRKLQMVQERFLRDDLSFVELSHLDLELALAKGLADQVRIRRGDQGLLPLVVHLQDRKSTRLNSSHRCISYAVFCLKKKKNLTPPPEHLRNQPSVPTGRWPEWKVEHRV